jgi:hypothetical protein
MFFKKRATVVVLASLLLVSLVPQVAASTTETTLVSWKLTVGGKTISLTGAAGELARAEAEGKMFALAPEVEDLSNQVVTFRLIEITKVDAENEILRQVEKFSLRPGAAYSTAWLPRLTVLLDRISQVEGEDAAAKPAPGKEDLVYWSVRVPAQGGEKKEVKFVGRSGELARIQGGDLTLGFRPKVRDTLVDFDVFQIVRAGEEGEVLTEIGSYTLETGGQVNSRKPSFSIELTQIAAVK